MFICNVNQHWVSNGDDVVSWKEFYKLGRLGAVFEGDGACIFLEADVLSEIVDAI